MPAGTEVGHIFELAEGLLVPAINQDLAVQPQPDTTLDANAENTGGCFSGVLSVFSRLFQTCRYPDLLGAREPRQSADDGTLHVE